MVLAVLAVPAVLAIVLGETAVVRATGAVLAAALVALSIAVVRSERPNGLQRRYEREIAASRAFWSHPDAAEQYAEELGAWRARVRITAPTNSTWAAARRRR